MTCIVRCALACAMVLVIAVLAAAQGQPTPVMRIGEWVEIGGEPPVVVILQAQERLKASGLDPGPIDGILDTRTRAALRQYQQRQGLPVTGVLDTATQNALGIK